MIDMHQVHTMDTDGLLHLLDLHRRGECMGLRTLIVGWQPQPRQLMATVAGTPGPSPATAERYALASFRRLLQDRAQRARDRAALDTGALPHP
ncbi:STAS domain-containing protein [Streptomyces xanthophaeus]